MPLTKADYLKAEAEQQALRLKLKGLLSHEVAQARGTSARASPALCVRTLKSAELGKVYCVAWSAGSDLIAAAHQHGAITVKAASNGGHKNLPILFPASKRVVPMACAFFNEDSMLAVGGMDNVITLFDRSVVAPEERRVLTGHDGYVSALKVLTPTRILSGSGDSTVRLWDTASGAEVSCFRAHEGDCTGLDCVAADPHMFVSSSMDTTCRVWDVRTGKATRVFKAKYSANCVAMHPSGKMLACGCDGASFEYWDLRSYNQIARGKVKRGRCAAIAFSSSGALTYMGWDSPDAGYVMCAETFFCDKQARAESNSHTDTVTTMRLAPDGSALATGGFDACTKLWTAPPG
jgi:guanine nucleotide-binding protein subunit beta-5